MRLSGIVHSIGNMDYIPPARYPEDLAHIPAEQMAELIRKLAADCGYEIIILDVGNYGHQAAPILSVCQIVYMPIKEDGISSAKIWEFEAYAERTGNSGMLDKVKKLKLPYTGIGRRENYELSSFCGASWGIMWRKLMRGSREEMEC